MRTRGSQRRRPPKGVVSIELLLLMPYFALLLFSTYFLGDIMLVQEKTELAARYAAWKQRPTSSGLILKTFFGGQNQRNQIQSVEVKQGLGDRRYPKTKGDNTEQTAGGALGGPPRFVYDPLSPSSLPYKASRRVAEIAFEGNTSGRNKVSHSSYYGTDKPASKGGGGWVMEQWGTVVTRYRPMGYTSLNMTLAAAHKVLMGKDYHTEINETWADFYFRQAKARVPPKTGIAETHDDVKGTSWENSGLMKELQPRHEVGL